MSLHIAYETQWWAWWSNPVVGLHEEKMTRISVPRSLFGSLNYFQLIQVRSTLGLDDLPDELLTQCLELRSLALANTADHQDVLLKLALLTMDSTVLHCNAQDWETQYGVTSADQIRRIVVLKNEFPRELLQWQEINAHRLRADSAQDIHLDARIQLGLALFLKSFFPRFFKRWELTQSNQIGVWTSNLELLPEDRWETLHEWCKEMFTSFHSSVYSAFELPDLDFDDSDLRGLSNPFEQDMREVAND